MSFASLCLDILEHLRSKFFRTQTTTPANRLEFFIELGQPSRFHHHRELPTGTRDVPLNPPFAQEPVYTHERRSGSSKKMNSR
jgi:hypothetical protein